MGTLIFQVRNLNELQIKYISVLYVNQKKDSLLLACHSFLTTTRKWRVLKSNILFKMSVAQIKK